MFRGNVLNVGFLAHILRTRRIDAPAAIARFCAAEREGRGKGEREGHGRLATTTGVRAVDGFSDKYARVAVVETPATQAPAFLK
jgi:hypothetical protein